MTETTTEAPAIFSTGYVKVHVTADEAYAELAGENGGEAVLVRPVFDTAEVAAAYIAELGLPKFVRANAPRLSGYYDGLYDANEPLRNAPDSERRDAYMIRCYVAPTTTRNRTTSATTGGVNETGLRRLRRFLDACVAAA